MTHSRTRGLAAALPLVLLTLAAGCAGGQGAAPPPTDSPADEWIMPPGAEVPDMTISIYQGAEAVGGDEVRLSQVLGQGKPVVLNFWAALCPPCRAEMPELQAVHAARGNEVTVLGIDIGPQQHLGTRDQGRELLQELGVHFPAGTTFNENVALDYRLLVMPSTLFIYPDGSLLRTWTGPLTESKLNDLIDEMLEG
ncbi:MAG: TlpA disulfide reductase family protein [Dehalococcoidia bacterium]